MHRGVGYHEQCVKYGAIEKHVSRGHVFEWRTAGEIRHWPTVGRMTRKRLHPRTPGRCSRSAHGSSLLHRWPRGAHAIARAMAAGQILSSNMLILSNARVWGNRRQAVSFEDRVNQKTALDSEWTALKNCYLGFLKF